MIPRELSDAVESALGETLVGTAAVRGGCINRGSRLETTNGRTFFLKWNERTPAEMFVAEVDGLQALREATELRIPEPVAWGGDTDTPSWLVMEFVRQGAPGEDFDARLGRGLAALHAAPAGPEFGWRRDNWIGALEQHNSPSAAWSEFWRDRRIEPQVAAARARGLLADPALDRVLEVIPSALDVHVDPSLLHGDLWSGNVYADEVGAPVLIDPAVYTGHSEVDLAMTELFGGFGARFYSSYREAAGVDAEYDAFRRDLYQLFYLLVHVNLFGASYQGACLAAARRVVAVLGA